MEGWEFARLQQPYRGMAGVGGFEPPATGLGTRWNIQAMLHALGIHFCFGVLLLRLDASFRRYPSRIPRIRALSGATASTQCRFEAKTGGDGEIVDRTGGR